MEESASNHVDPSGAFHKPHEHHQDHAVHFSAEQVPYHESEIIVKHDAEDLISAHLGFLQINHYYEVRFSIKDDLGEDVKSDPLENLHLKIKDIMPSEDGEGHDLVLDLLAHKEKLMKEQVTIRSKNNPERLLNIMVHARVLGKGKGTPSLKTGIHCTGINVEEESELSDWQGFD